MVTYLGHKPMLFNTTDSATNMKLLSHLIGHERIDCTAHCLHLLLTVDSMLKVPEFCALLKKFKEIASALHFKGHLISQEVINEEDAKLFEKIRSVQEQLCADKDNPIEQKSSEKSATELMMIM